jgi:hypothetical protein
MTDRELMQMALDALEELKMEHSQNMKVPEEWYSYYQKQDTALEALRNRLAQPERVHAIDISQKRVDETAKDRHESVEYLIPVSWYGDQPLYAKPTCTAPPKREWVGLDGDIPGLGLVTEEFYNGMLCAEDILRKRNT